MRKQGYTTRINKAKLLDELQFHPIFLQKKLNNNDNDLESIFLEYGY